jgi:membrane-bound lytic murein transglycosylase D
MAAYNCGPYCVDKAVQRTGYADFWQLCAHNALPRQTQNYVPLILAITIMAKNPHDYGLDNIDGDLPIEYDTVAISEPTNLWLVSDIADRPLSEIHELNPSLIKSLAPAGYQLRVPKGTAPSITAALEQVPAERRAGWRMHRVTEGETLAAIAHHFNVSPATIASTNRIQVEAPATGDLLLIPASCAIGQSSRRPAVHTAKAHHRSHTAVARNVSPRVLQHRASKRQPRLAGVVRHRRSH